MRKELVNKSRFLSLILRHKPEKIGLKMDENGWLKVSDITKKSDITMSEMKEIVETNEKKRFEFDTHEMRIRARQGHSKKVDLELEEKTPPDILLHGSNQKVKDKILKEGLNKMNRNHVHLSIDVETANKVGKRRGKVVVFQVDSKKMSEDGHKFYLSNNGVWLTDKVGPEYLRLTWSTNV